MVNANLRLQSIHFHKAIGDVAYAMFMSLCLWIPLVFVTVVLVVEVCMHVCVCLPHNHRFISLTWHSAEKAQSTA